MVSVSDIQRGHLAELLCDSLRVLGIVDNPELVAETVDGSYEVVLRSRLGIAHDEFVENTIVGVGEEYRLDVGIVYANVLHAVFFLVATRQLVLLDIAFLVVVGMSAYNEAILRLALHGLSVDIIVLFFVLY